MLKTLAVPLVLVAHLGGLSGYVKIHSFYFEGFGQKTFLHAARLRLKWDHQRDPWFVRVHSEFAAVRSDPAFIPLLAGSFLDQANAWFLYRDDEARVYQFFDRLSVGLQTDRFSLTLGRDRYAWGKARLFSVLDLFNPYEPFALVKEERQGVNGGRMRWYFSGFTWLEAVYARVQGRDEWGVSLFTTAGDFDLQLAVGHMDQDLVGLAVEGQVGDFGVRGEVVWRRDGRTEFNVGFDVQVHPDVYLMGEVLRSRGGFFPVGEVYTLSMTWQFAALNQVNLTLVVTRPTGRIVLVGYTHSVTGNLDLNLSLLYGSRGGAFPLPRLFGPGLAYYF